MYSAIPSNHWIDALLHAPMHFFDTTPSGRIMNRFSKDVDVIDFAFPDNFWAVLFMLSQIVGTFLVVVYSTPLVLLVLVPVFAAFCTILYFYLPATRQIRRLEATSRSPVFSHVAETIAGPLLIYLNFTVLLNIFPSKLRNLHSKEFFHHNSEIYSDSMNFSR